MPNPANDFEKPKGNNSEEMSSQKENWATTQGKLMQELYGDIEKPEEEKQIDDVVRDLPTGKRFPIDINGNFITSDSADYFLEVTKYTLNNNEVNYTNLPETIKNENDKNKITVHFRIDLDENSKFHIDYDIPLNIFLENDSEKVLKYLMNTTVAASADALTKEENANNKEEPDDNEETKPIEEDEVAAVAQKFVEKSNSEALPTGVIKQETIKKNLYLHLYRENSQITLCLNQNGFWSVYTGSESDRLESNESINE